MTHSMELLWYRKTLPRRRKPPLTAALLLSFLGPSLVGPHAVAEPQGPAAALKAEAEGLYLEGDFAGALARLERAASVDPDPGLLANQGLVLERLGRYEEAGAKLARYLELNPPADKLLLASEALRRVRPTLNLESSPPGAAVFVDAAEAPAGVTPLMLPLSVGTHGLRFERPGHLPARLAVRVAPGASEAVRATLLPEQAGPDATRVDAVRPGVAATQPGVRDRIGWVLLGTGLTGLAVGGALYARTLDIEDDRDDAPTAADRADAQDRLDRFDTATYATTGASAALFALGLGLLLADSVPDTPGR